MALNPLLILLAFGCEALTMTSSLTNSLPDVTNAPVFGVLALETDARIKDYIKTNASSYIASSYVKYLEMSGARVVPINPFSSYDEIDKLLSMVNGVLFTGGDSPFWTPGSLTPELSEDYAAKGCYIFNKIKQFNDKGSYYPLWATCLGHELLHICTSNKFSTISNYEGEPPYSQVQQFTRLAHKSPIFTYISPDIGHEVLYILSTQKVSALSHHFGISPETYEKDDKISGFFEVLSYIQDHEGNFFVGMTQAKKYPIFTTQFHPEKNMFEFTRDTFDHGTDGVFAMTYLSGALVAMARKNANVFPEAELTKYIIYNYQQVYVNFIFETIYLFS